jgi:hypothetical protein
MNEAIIPRNNACRSGKLTGELARRLHVPAVQPERRLIISPLYSDGTPKPYSARDTHRQMVRKARASWEWDI